MRLVAKSLANSRKNAKLIDENWYLAHADQLLVDDVTPFVANMRQVCRSVHSLSQ